MVKIFTRIELFLYILSLFNDRKLFENDILNLITYLWFFWESPLSPFVPCPPKAVLASRKLNSLHTGRKAQICLFKLF